MQFAGEAGEELSNFFLAHLGRVPFVVEKDEPLDPMNIAVLGLGTVMARADRLTDLIGSLGFGELEAGDAAGAVGPSRGEI